MKFEFEREYQLSIHHTKVSVIEWGDPDAEPVVCLHGWLDNAATFHYLAPLLKDKYRLIAIEFPGHGQSEHLPPAADYQFVSGISVIDGALEVLQLDKVKFIGHSMGAALGLIYAGVMPHKIEKLVSIDALGPFTTEPAKTVEQLAEAIEHRKSIRGNKRFFESVETATKARAQVSELDVATLLPLIERGVILTEKGYQWSSDARLKQASWIRMTEAQLDYLLANVSADIQLLEAQNGLLKGMLAPMLDRASKLSSFERHQLAGGHHLHMQYPEQVAAKILEFFAKE